MSGINHLYDIYNKKGNEFVDQLFNTYVTVNEKMDGSAFTFERDKETGKFKFYRRDQRNPITFVDRTLMKYYEKPIQYIESLPPHILEQIPRGWRFGLEYFANTKPVEITYDTMPKNHLILSYVHEFGEDGKIKKTIQNKEELDDWADLLGIDRAPIIFQGYLTDDQKSQILDFLKTPFDQLVERFKTQSFVRFIIGTLNPELKKSALNNDLDKDVEGIVFRFGDSTKDSEPVLAKMVDPVFTQMAKDKSMKQKENKPSDFLGITLLDVMNFILEEGIDSFKVEGDSEDERYVSFMSDVFAKFLEENEDKYRGADFEEPDYLKREEFRLNKDLIDDRRVLKYVNEDDSFESLFKLMLNSFRKIKSRAGGIITKGMMEQMNLLIRDIKDYIEKPRKGKMNESFMSFLDFKKENSPVVEYLKEEDSETEADENPFYSYGEFITALETIDNSKSGVVEEKEEKKDLKDVNLLVGRFQPFHNGHLKMAKFLKEKNDFPSVAVVVYPGHNKSGKSPFKEDTIKKYMDGVVRDESEIADYIIVQRGLIGSAIVKLMEKGYKPHLIGAGEDRIDDYTKQLEYVKKSEIGEEMKDLKLIKTPRVTSATKVREAIADDDYQEVKRLVPKGVSVLYNTLKSEVDGTGVNESLSYEDLEFPISLNESISLEVLNKDLKTLGDYLDDLNKISSIEDLTPEERSKLESIHDNLVKAKRIIQEFSGDEIQLQKKISDLLFGIGLNKKSQIKKFQQVNSLMHEISDSTMEGLIQIYVKGETPKDTPNVTIEDILQKNISIYDINRTEGMNGIAGRDIRKVYNFDTTLGTGLQQRGRGETLFCLSFDARNNPEAGGDVILPEVNGNKVVEIKSTNNAGITPRTDAPISSDVKMLIAEANRRFPNPELAKGRIQKNTSLHLISELKKETEEINDFITFVERITGLKIDKISEGHNKKYKIDDLILPIILLLQLNYYSGQFGKSSDEISTDYSILGEESTFSMLAVYIEDAGAPDKLVLLDSNSTDGFLTHKNILTLKESGIAPKITASNRMEIYRFEK